MTINERVKHFRKNILHVSQTEFANKLGMKQTGVSYMERDGSTVTDQTIKAICLLFNVNEEWLRNGVEPIYIGPDTFSLDEFMKQRGATELEKQIVKTYFNLDPDTREMLVDHFRKGLTVPAPENAMKKLGNEAPVPGRATHEMTREELHAELDRQLDAEKEAAGNARGYGRGSSGTAAG